jgi:hypothetical protein
MQPNTGLTQLSIWTLPELALPTSPVLTSSSEGSPANPTAWQVKEWGRMIAGTSGLNSLVSLANFDPTQFFWKMCQASLNLDESMADGSQLSLSRFLATLPNWVTWDALGLFQLPQSERPNFVRDGGAWPTPKATNIEESVEQWEKRRAKPGNKKMGASLVVATKFWSTPTAQNYKNASLPAAQLTRNSLTGNMTQDYGVRAGYLNPNWVEPLMGYPPGWTDIDGLLAEEQNNSNGNHPASQAA